MITTQYGMEIEIIGGDTDKETADIHYPDTGHTRYGVSISELRAPGGIEEIYETIKRTQSD